MSTLNSSLFILIFVYIFVLSLFKFLKLVFILLLHLIDLIIFAWFHFIVLQQMKMRICPRQMSVERSVIWASAQMIVWQQREVLNIPTQTCSVENCQCCNKPTGITPQAQQFWNPKHWECVDCHVSDSSLKCCVSGVERSAVKCSWIIFHWPSAADFPLSLFVLLAINNSISEVYERTGKCHLYKLQVPKNPQNFNRYNTFKIY